MKMPSFFRPRLERKIGSVGIWFRELEQLTHSTSEPVIEFDISRLQTINSEEISALVEIQLKLSHEGRRLCLMNPQDPIAEVFELIRLDRLIQLRWEQVAAEHPDAINRASIA